MKVAEVLKMNVKYNYEVSGIAIDSRSVKRNDIFVCIDGYNHSGNEFVSEVINKKVRTIVTSSAKTYTSLLYNKINIILVGDTTKTLAEICKRFYNDISKKICLVGITGTNGKTTVATLLYKYYRYLGKNVSYIGTNGIYINDDYYESANTTPNILLIYETFKKSLLKDINLVVMEVSSQGIKEGRILGLDFDIGLLTNLSLDHLDYHKTFDDYMYCKMMFLTQSKNVIVNRDSFKFYEINRLINKELITFGICRDDKSLLNSNYSNFISPDCDYEISNIECDIEKTVFDIRIKKDENYHIRTSLLGEYNVYNIASFIAILDLLDSFNQYTLSFLSKKITIDGRFELINTSRGKVVIDFAHTPEAVKSILTLLNGIKTRKIITVIGMGGDRDKSKRKIVGKIVSSLSDIVILTEDNSRGEKPIDIIEMIKKGIDSDNNVYVEESRAAAIKKAYYLSQAGDIIAILGKGNEKYIIKGSEKILFSDKDEVYKLALRNS